MASDAGFRELLTRAWHGDREAEGLIYREFRPHIERLIQIRLRELHIAWAVEPLDVYDAVWVVARQRNGVQTIEDALSFCRYLEGATRKKTQEILRHMTAQKRDFRRLCSLCYELPDSSYYDPAARAEFDEQFTLAWAQLSFREQSVCILYREGRSWVEIATELETTADAARMVHHRAEQRVCKWLRTGKLQFHRAAGPGQRPQVGSQLPIGMQQTARLGG